MESYNKNNFIVDTHIHTFICKHAEGTNEEYILDAIKKNIDVIGFSEHAPFFGIDDEHRGSEKDTLKHLNELKKLKEKYKDQIKILIGLEMDYLPSKEKQIREYLKDKELDYIMGSVHFATDKTLIEIYEKKRVYTEKIFNEYFEMLEKAVKSNLFNCLSHPDLILITGMESELFYEKIKKVIMTMKEHKIAYEINTSGYFKTRYDHKTNDLEPTTKIMPDFKAIKFAADNNIPLSIGSDSHSPNNLTRYFEKTRNKLKELGINTLSYFENKKRIDYKI